MPERLPDAADWLEHCLVSPGVHTPLSLLLLSHRRYTADVTVLQVAADNYEAVQATLGGGTRSVTRADGKVTGAASPKAKARELSPAYLMGEVDRVQPCNRTPPSSVMSAPDLLSRWRA